MIIWKSNKFVNIIFILMIILSSIILPLFFLSYNISTNIKISIPIISNTILVIIRILLINNPNIPNEILTFRKLILKIKDFDNVTKNELKKIYDFFNIEYNWNYFKKLLPDSNYTFNNNHNKIGCNLRLQRTRFYFLVIDKKISLLNFNGEMILHNNRYLEYRKESVSKKQIKQFFNDLLEKIKIFEVDLINYLYRKTKEKELDFLLY
ncbi:MAG: hypothetical protein JXA99_17240 [Candidatus Lokiarchaeota archaeon]|nr:hypothetical protein [Candidatus Lokiarchaeota archaeon]